MKIKKTVRSLIIATLLVCLLAPSAAQATFTQASADLRNSNSQASLAVYYGLLTLFYGQSYLAYYSYTYMDSADDFALSGYQNAQSAYASNYSYNGYLSAIYSYYDWYYKSQASLSIYYAYLYYDTNYGSQAIFNAYLALYYTGFSSYYTGLAASGGTK